MIKKIITHPGNAHRDEVIAIALLLASDLVKEDCEVVRQYPAESHLKNPNIAVIDVGGTLDYTLCNLDHHQQNDTECAVSLVLQHLGLYEDALVVFKWLEFTEVNDCHGPVYAASFIGVTPRHLEHTASPIERFLISKFGAKRGKASIEMVGLLRELGEELLNQITRYKDKLALLDAEVTTDTSEMVDLTFIPKDAKVDPLEWCDDWLTLRGLTTKCYKVHNQRGDGFCLYRHKEVGDSVDFRLGDYSRLGKTFVHNSGFMCCVEETADIKAILNAASVS